MHLLAPAALPTHPPPTRGQTHVHARLPARPTDAARPTSQPGPPDQPATLTRPALRGLLDAGTPLSSWITAIIFLAAPCGTAEGCGAAAMVSRICWPLTLTAPYWIAAVTNSWAYCAVGGTVAGWYATLAPPPPTQRDLGEGGDGAGDGSAADLAASELGKARQRLSLHSSPMLPKAPYAPAHAPVASSGATGSPRRKWLLWRSGWLALDAHLSAIVAAAFLLPFASTVHMVIPPVAPPARRAANPYSRMCLGCIQGCLRCARTLTRSVHPGALVLLARYAPIGTYDEGEAAETFASAGSTPVFAARRTPRAPPPTGFLDAGERCAMLFQPISHGASAAANLSAVREHCAYFYALIKWTIAFGVALIGWACLTATDASPLLSPLWPSAIILEGSFALASAALSVHEAALEALLQCYASEAADAADAPSGDQQVGSEGAALSSPSPFTPSSQATAAHHRHEPSHGDVAGLNSGELHATPLVDQAAAADRAAALFGTVSGGGAGMGASPPAYGAFESSEPFPHIAAYPASVDGTFQAPPLRSAQWPHSCGALATGLAQTTSDTHANAEIHAPASTHLPPSSYAAAALAEA